MLDEDTERGRNNRPIDGRDDEGRGTRQYSRCEAHGPQGPGMTEGVIMIEDGRRRAPESGQNQRNLQHADTKKTNAITETDRGCYILRKPKVIFSILVAAPSEGGSRDEPLLVISLRYNIM